MQNSLLNLLHAYSLTFTISLTMKTPMMKSLQLKKVKEHQHPWLTKVKEHQLRISLLLWSTGIKSRRQKTEEDHQKNRLQVWPRGVYSSLYSRLQDRQNKRLHRQRRPKKNSLEKGSLEKAPLSKQNCRKEPPPKQKRKDNTTSGHEYIKKG
jgi:hypothetical protein